jgi:hypothetical protein
MSWLALPIMEQGLVLTILIIFEFKFTTKTAEWACLGIIKTSSKIIKERLPLKQNTEKEFLLFRFL